MASPPATCRPTFIWRDVYLVVAENGADEADEPWHVLVREEQHDAVEVGIEVERAELHEAQDIGCRTAWRRRCTSSCRLSRRHESAC